MIAMTAPAIGTTPDRIELDGLDRYRSELHGYCYRMLGSGFEAEDAVQETMLRAWRAGAAFEGRSSLRTWLYSIATNVCLDLLRGRARRDWPIGLGPPSAPDGPLRWEALPEDVWVWPVADAAVLPAGGDPAEIAVARETIRLAFVTALQHLPPRQRAALVLCQVLRFEAAEVARQLDTTAAAVSSALRRARATLSAVRGDERPAEVDGDHAELLARYIDAFERYDIPALVDLLHEDAAQLMPPYPVWLRGAADIGAFMLGPGSKCHGSRLLPAAANGCPTFGQYRVDPDGGHRPWALHVLEISGGRVARVHSFLDPGRLFQHFGLPAHLPA